MPISAVDLSAGEALRAVAASEGTGRSNRGRNRGILKERITASSVDSAVDGLLDIIGSISDIEDGGSGDEDARDGERAKEVATGKRKRKSKKRLRAEATTASADLQRRAAEAAGNVTVAPEASMFYRYIPVGKAFTDCLKNMKARGFLKPGSDGKLQRLFDDAAKEITENSEMTLSVPDLQRSSSRSSSSSKNTPTIEGKLVSYNNYKNNWQLEVEDAVVHRSDEILFELPRGKLFIKANDSKPSIKARKSR